MINIIKNVLVFVFLYIPPLLIFVKFWKERNKNKVLIGVIILLYLVGSLFTNNLLPFIMVVIDIVYIKKASKEIYFTYGNGISNELKEDFYRFKFSLRKFNIFTAAKSFLTLYLIIILVASITNYIINKFKLEGKEQEIVTWMSNMPMNKFLIMVPIIIIFAPILEEFIFRWFFFEKVFKNRVGLVFSAILSSLIFAMIHFNLRAFPILILIGVYNCYTIHNKGYWYAVFNHFSFNLITTLALFFQKI